MITQFSLTLFAKQLWNKIAQWWPFRLFMSSLTKDTVQQQPKSDSFSHGRITRQLKTDNAGNNSSQRKEPRSQREEPRSQRKPRRNNSAQSGASYFDPRNPRTYSLDPMRASLLAQEEATRGPGVDSMHAAIVGAWGLPG